MELNDRKIRILQAIIKNYLETAEPVGSRTISKKYDFGIGSATIRNEMSDLEELGFIIQPHTSAGRVPSDKGYRLYVDQMMQYGNITDEQMYIIKRILMQKVNRLDNLLKDIGDLISVLTNYTTLVTTPQYKKTKLKHMQLVPLDAKSVILVIVTDGNIVRNHVLETIKPLEVNQLVKMSNMLNHFLQGLTLEDINLPLIQLIKKELGEHSQIMDKLLDAIAETIKYADDIDLYTSGTTNIFEFPEFSDVIKAKNIIQMLEKKDILLDMLNDNDINDTFINIKIGNENKIAELKDCSVITTTYKIGGRTVGTIGVLGPTRMDYEKVVSTLGYIMKNIDPVINLKNMHKRE